MLADRAEAGSKKDSELSKAGTLNPKPLTLIPPPYFKLGFKGQGIFRGDFGQCIFVIRGAFNKRGIGLVVYKYTSILRHQCRNILIYVRIY